MQKYTIAKIFLGFWFIVGIILLGWFISVLIRHILSSEAVLALGNTFIYSNERYFLEAKRIGEEDRGLIVILGNTLYPSSSPFYYPTLKYKDLIDCLAWYESRNNQNRVGKYGEIGILQFKKSTWNYFCKKFDVNLDIYNEEHQRLLADLILRDNFWNIKHWTVWKRCIN